MDPIPTEDYCYVDFGWLCVDTTDPSFDPTTYVAHQTDADIANLVKYTYNFATERQRIYLHYHYPNIVGGQSLLMAFANATKPVGAP